MEEAEKRRERLRAMRMEAQAEVSSNTCSSSQQTISLSTPSSLSNPLLEKTHDDSGAAAPRFGFYTDPMAAFSYEKRQTGHQPRTPFPQSPSGPLNPEMPIYGVRPFQNSYSPHYNTQHVDPYYNPGSSASPMGIQRPYVYQGSPTFNPASGRGQGLLPNSSPGWGNGGSPYPMHQGSPTFNPASGRGQGQLPNSSPGWGSGGSPYPMHQGSPTFNPASGRGQGQLPNSSPGRGSGGSPYPMHQGNQNFRTPPPGRGRWSNNTPTSGLGRGGSPSPNTGRERGRWDGNRMSPGPRWSNSGRGRGSYFDGQTRSFYNKSMVEDPWESLTPVIWQVVSTPAFVLRTPVMKKPRVASPFDTSNSNQSLAEFLAASFDEAVKDVSTE